MPAARVRALAAAVVGAAERLTHLAGGATPG
jgi:hypothetical protein